MHLLPPEDHPPLDDHADRDGETVRALDVERPVRFEDRSDAVTQEPHGGAKRPDVAAGPTELDGLLEEVRRYTVAGGQGGEDPHRLPTVGCVDRQVDDRVHLSDVRQVVVDGDVREGAGSMENDAVATTSGRTVGDGEVHRPGLVLSAHPQERGGTAVAERCGPGYGEQCCPASRHRRQRAGERRQHASAPASPPAAREMRAHLVHRQPVGQGLLPRHQAVLSAHEARPALGIVHVDFDASASLADPGALRAGEQNRGS